jgi:23S rRNA pseudouridine2605 synthase
VTEGPLLDDPTGEADDGESPRRGRPGRRAAARAARERRTAATGGPGAGLPAGGGMRLNKLLASRGIGARRKCDELILGGSVRVNGTVVKEPGVQVQPERDRVEVHGRAIPGRAALRYLMVHKPVGVITTLDDPEGRPTVRGLLPPGPRLFPVGRLDAETSGLLIATNDGALAHHLMHPRYGVRKVYRVRVDRPPDAEQIRRLRTGVEFEKGTVSAPCEVRLRNARAERAELEIALHEGRYRQVRRMCEAVGLAVRRLHRPAYGPLRLGTLPRGAWRELTTEEVRRLRAASARPAPRPARATAQAPGRTAPGRRLPAPRRPDRVARSPGRRPPHSPPGASTRAGGRRPGARPPGPFTRPPGPRSAPGRGTPPRRPPGPGTAPGRGGRPRPGESAARAGRGRPVGASPRRPAGRASRTTGRRPAAKGTRRRSSTY